MLDIYMRVYIYMYSYTYIYIHRKWWVQVCFSAVTSVELVVLSSYHRNLVKCDSSVFLCFVLILLFACMIIIIPTSVPNLTLQPPGTQHMYMSFCGGSFCQFYWHLMIAIICRTTQQRYFLCEYFFFNDLGTKHDVKSEEIKDGSTLQVQFD